MAQSELLVEVVRIQENPKIAEVHGDGWSFIRILREEIENRKPLPLEKLKSSGIYFLNGIDWGAHCFKFCVGKAPRSNECFLKRIDGVDLAQRWWENIFFLTSFPDGEFNDADLHYLEKRFRDQNEPTPGVHLGKGRESLDGIIREITLFMNIMGWNISNTPQSPPPPKPTGRGTTGDAIFNTPQSPHPSKRGIETPPQPPPTGERGSFYHLEQKVNKTYRVEAFCKETSEHYTVLKGSTIAPWNARDKTRKESGRRSKYLCAMRKKWAKSSTLTTLTEDVSFRSHSAAAMFVTGNKSADGPEVWKHATEKEYRKFLEKPANE